MAILEDNIDETDETVQLTLSNPQNSTLGTNETAVFTIEDNEPPPVMQFTTDTLSVGEAAGTITATVMLSSTSADAIQIDYITVNGTATAGSDYAALNDTLIFAPGEDSKEIVLSVFNNGSAEPPETVEIQLSNPQNVTLGTPDMVTVTILDDDVVPLVQLTAGSLTVAEDGGSVDIEVTLSEASANEVTVDFATTGGTAVSGQDYNLIGTTLTFAPGTVSGIITLDLRDDALQEGNELLTILLSNPSNAIFGTPKSILITIQDDDVQFIYLPIIIR